MVFRSCDQTTSLRVLLTNLLSSQSKMIPGRLLRSLPIESTTTVVRAKSFILKSGSSSGQASRRSFRILAVWELIGTPFSQILTVWLWGFLKRFFGVMERKALSFDVSLRQVRRITRSWRRPLIQRLQRTTDAARSGAGEGDDCPNSTLNRKCIQ